MTKCSCCGDIIEPGGFTRTQLAAVDALTAAIAAYRAASEIRLKTVVETTAATVGSLFTVLSELERHAPIEQKVAIREALQRAGEALSPAKPS
jgi:hypothetical protein